MSPSRPPKYGACGALMDVNMNRGACQMFEAQGYDFVIWADQMSMTIPRSIWTPDIAAGAEAFDIDTNMDAWVMAADTAGHTETIELGITVNDALRRTPANYAQQVLTMDHLSQGRFFHGMGGGEMRHFKPYGVERNKPFGHLEESVKIQKMLMESPEPVSYDGPIWKLDKALMTAMPFGEKPPPILIAGGGRAMKIAGEHADGWITMLPAGGDPEHYAKQVAQVKEYAEAAGRDPDELIFYALILAVIAGSEDEAEEMTNNPLLRWDSIALIPDPEVFASWGIMQHPIRPDYSYARDIISQDWGREETLEIIEKIPPELVRKARATGTPAQVADELQGYIDAGCEMLNIINYAAFVGSGNFADSVQYQALVSETIRLLRERNGQDVPPGLTPEGQAQIMEAMAAGAEA
jgi:phthiodiolone/phenolphthiodiolone dimycocerosates ketoreductase